MRKSLREREGQLPDEVLIPCRVLRETTEIGCVAPQAWEGFCKRRTSWYLSSGNAGRFLIVSRYPLGLPGLEDSTLVMGSNFNPERLPNSGEIAEMVQSASFQESKPRIWDRVDQMEREFQRRWFKRHGINERFDFDQVFMVHSANHSNFINPRFYVFLNGSKSPYSIATSARVCSSCLEFFNILGEKWPVKYVIPCIGAVQFARLPKDRYFRVETP